VVSIEAGIYTVTGQAVTLTYTPVGGYTLTIEPGAFTVTGQAVDLLKASRLEITPGAYAVTGQDATLTLGTALAIPIIIHIDGRAFIRDLDKRLKIARLEVSPKIRNVDKRR
jgi:hypothetical protein